MLSEALKVNFLVFAEELTNYLVYLGLRLQPIAVLESMMLFPKRGILSSNRFRACVLSLLLLEIA